MPQPVVTYVLANNMGGITSMLNNLIAYRGSESLPQEAIILSIKESTAAPIAGVFGEGIPVVDFAFSKKSNWFHLYKKLSQLAGKHRGVLVSNDVYDLLMLGRFNIDKKVVQIVHDGYNLQLAVRYGDVVDSFIAHSLFFYEVLCQLFPHRSAHIFHVPYGIALPKQRRKPVAANKPLTLVFAGRHDEGKGIFNLLAIERLLSAKNIQTSWLILGRGPETARLTNDWAAQQNVLFVTPEHNNEVMELLSRGDVFVFPTRFEGFPVALLEAMGAGLVPVATNLPGGLREMVQQGKNGFLCAMDDVAAFAAAIEWLHYNRQALEEISNNAFTLLYILNMMLLCNHPNTSRYLRIRLQGRGHPVTTG